MRVRKHAMTVVAVLAAGAMALTGCSGSASPGASDPAASSSGSAGGNPGKEVTLSYFTWNNEANMQPIVDVFQEANPGITIELSSANNDPIEYARTLLARASGNQLPDIFHMSLESRTEIINAGLAKDITNEDFLKGSDTTAHEMYSKDGKVYGMSLSAWAGVIIYNVDLLKKAGHDSVPTDLDGFIQLGKDLQAAGITAYMEDPGNPSGSFIPMLGGYYAKQGKSDQAIFDGEESFSTWEPVITQWQRIIDEGVMPKEVIGVSGDQVKQNFISGQVAMYRAGAWDFADLAAGGINFGTAPFPAIDGGEPYIGGGPDSPYALSATLEGDKLAAAEKFLSFMNSEEGLKLAEENLGQVSTSKNYSANVAPELADVYKNYLQTGKYYWINWPDKGAIMGNELVAQFQLLMQGQATPEAVAAALDTKWKS